MVAQRGGFQRRRQSRHTDTGTVALDVLSASVQYRVAYSVAGILGTQLRSQRISGAPDEMKRVHEHDGIMVGMPSTDVRNLPRRQTRYWAVPPDMNEKDRRGAVVTWRYRDGVKVVFKHRYEKGGGGTLCLRVTEIRI